MISFFEELDREEDFLKYKVKPRCIKTRPIQLVNQYPSTVAGRNNRSQKRPHNVPNPYARGILRNTSFHQLNGERRYPSTERKGPTILEWCFGIFQNEK